MAERPKTDIEKVGERNTGLVSAFQSVTDGVIDLIKSHLDLAQAEARRDFRAYRSEAARAGVGMALAVVGFGLINLSVVFVAGYFGGLVAMAITTFVLGVCYMWFGASTSRAAMARMKAREGALTSTRDEIKRSTEWVKEITETS